MSQLYVEKRVKNWYQDYRWLTWSCPKNIENQSLKNLSAIASKNLKLETLPNSLIQLIQSTDTCCVDPNFFVIAIKNDHLNCFEIYFSFIFKNLNAIDKFKFTKYMLNFPYIWKSKKCYNFVLDKKNKFKIKLLF